MARHYVMADFSVKTHNWALNVIIVYYSVVVLHFSCLCIGKVMNCVLNNSVVAVT